MVDARLLVKLLESLREQVDVIRPLQKLSLRELTDDPLRWNGLLHLLQVSVEHATDIGAHVLAGTNKETPDSHRLIFIKLGQTKILPLEFAERIAPMASFRNIVVHHYLSLDPEKVADILYNHLGDFDEFSFHIYDYLRREGYIKDETQDE
ncbi:MAG: DUF86 domain-containing protein [Chloroflexi bacterium]|nr:DUF86 domain-containing protein [Chloroflexota bacterium]